LFGLACFVMLFVVFFSWWGNYKFIETFDHETVHTLFGFLFFKKIHSFQATNVNGGVVYLNTSNFIITLAPYFFPLFLVIAVLLRIIIIPEWKFYADYFIGFAFGFHVFSSYRETSFRQPDIQSSGKLFSVIFITAMHLLTLTYLASYLIFDTAGFGINTDALINNGIDYYNIIVAKFSQ